jgi:hypothetical protein
MLGATWTSVFPENFAFCEHTIGKFHSPKQLTTALAPHLWHSLMKRLPLLAASKTADKEK